MEIPENIGNSSEFDKDGLHYTNPKSSIYHKNNPYRNNSLPLEIKIDKLPILFSLKRFFKDYSMKFVKALAYIGIFGLTIGVGGYTTKYCISQPVSCSDTSYNNAEYNRVSCDNNQLIYTTTYATYCFCRDHSALIDKEKLK